MVDLGLLEREEEREYNSRAWSWVAGISNVLSGLSYSKLKVILVTCNSGFLFLKRLCLSDKLYVCQSCSSLIWSSC